MRRWINLIAESLERHPSESDLEYFLEEGCVSFAMALWRMHDSQGSFRVLSNPDGEYWNGEPEITHVVFVDSNRIHYDVRGAQMPDEIAMHFGLSNSDWGDMFAPEYFWDNFVGDDDEYPLYGDEESIQMAVKLILEYPDIYGIRKS